MRQRDTVCGARTRACRGGTPADARCPRTQRRRVEIRRSTHECVRHGGSIATIVALCLLATGCAKRAVDEAESMAPVEVSAVAQDSIRRVVEADAVLYPIDQASVMPKISAPVQKFLVNRGDHVRAGQLLAVIENRDLVAAENAAKSQVDQADANLRSTESAAVPEAVMKAQTDVASDQEQLDAARRALESRQKLFQDGALARKSVDDAAVTYAQAKAQFETASEHLHAFQSVGKQEQIKTAQESMEVLARGFKLRASTSMLSRAWASRNKSRPRRRRWPRRR